MLCFYAKHISDPVRMRHQRAVQSHRRMKMNEHWTSLEQKLAGTEPDWQVLAPL